jgi:hypothetical protein
MAGGVRWPMAQEFNVLALLKGQEHYIFVYDDESRSALIDAVRDKAADPTMGLNWFDAAVLIQKAREQAANEGSREQRSGVSDYGSGARNHPFYPDN